MSMMKEVEEYVTFKNKKIVSTFGGTNNIRNKVLSYECKTPNHLLSCKLEKKNDQIYGSIS